MLLTIIGKQFLLISPMPKYSVTNRRGFSLAELLVVTVLIGILCQAAVTSITIDDETTLASFKDELTAFFKVCRMRAELRNMPLSIVRGSGQLFLKEDPTVFVKLKYLQESEIPAYINISSLGRFSIKEKPVSFLKFSMRVSKGSPNVHEFTLNL